MDEIGNFGLNRITKTFFRFTTICALSLIVGFDRGSSQTPVKGGFSDTELRNACEHDPDPQSSTLYGWWGPLASPSDFQKAKVCVYDKELDDVIGQLRKALEDSDASWEREFGESAVLQKRIESYVAHGGKFHYEQYGVDHDSPYVPGRSSGPKGLVEAEDNHHIWIIRNRRLLDFFVAGKSSLFGSRAAGLIFVGPDPPHSSYPQETLLHLKAHDDSMRALYQKLIDRQGWAAALREQIDENQKRSTPSTEDEQTQEATDRRLQDQLYVLEHDVPSFDQRTIPGTNGQTAGTYRLSGYDGYFATDSLWIEVALAMRRGGRIFLYAVCSDGLQAIYKLYVGVPTLVEVQLKTDYGKSEYQFELSAGGAPLKLGAHAIDQHNRIFRTDPFVPVAPKADTGPVFNPPNGPQR
jgi:hypothetical protein